MCVSPRVPLIVTVIFACRENTSRSDAAAIFQLFVEIRASFKRTAECPRVRWREVVKREPERKTAALEPGNSWVTEIMESILPSSFSVVQRRADDPCRRRTTREIEPYGYQGAGTRSSGGWQVLIEEKMPELRSNDEVNDMPVYYRRSNFTDANFITVTFSAA